MPKKPRDPSSPKYKARMGYEGEYGLVKMLVESGKPRTYAVRTPGSGSGKMSKPDIIAVEEGELYALEVKSSRKSYAMLSKEQVARLLDFCRRFGVRCPRCGREIHPKPVVAVRFLGYGWRFVEVPMDHKGSLIVKRDRSRATEEFFSF